MYLPEWNNSMGIAEIEDWTEEQNREKVNSYTFPAHINSYMDGNMLRFMFDRTLHDVETKT